MKSTYIVASLALLSVTGFAPAQQPDKSDLVVHEWGTFLTMSSSDGVTLDGMYHEEHALPRFVHSRTRDELVMPQVILKGETPVIYFYTHQKQNVSVGVKFTKGTWTQWYPQAHAVTPSKNQKDVVDKTSGHIVWRATILPSSESSEKLTPVPKDALWNYARDVDSALVQTVNNNSGKKSIETERFLFYRGLGQAHLPLKMTSMDNGTLTYADTERYPLSHLFVLRVENGKAAYRYIPALAPGESVRDVVPEMTDALALPEFKSRIEQELAQRLTDSGLYPKEARAMVNTWSKSYFETEGIRVLYVLPQKWTDGFIPLRLTPEPTKIVRVMVGRLELLTPLRERKVEKAVLDLASPDAAIRQQGLAVLREQGRYLEPVLRRTLKTSRNETVTKYCQRLLRSKYVTNLNTNLAQISVSQLLAQSNK